MNRFSRTEESPGEKVPRGAFADPPRSVPAPPPLPGCLTYMTPGHSQAIPVCPSVTEQPPAQLPPPSEGCLLGHDPAVTCRRGGSIPNDLIPNEEQGPPTQTDLFVPVRAELSGGSLSLSRLSRLTF